MQVYRLVAPRRMGRIPEGFEMMVYTYCNYCDVDDVKESLKRFGFTDDDSPSYASSGNWRCTRIK